jgi:predicted ribosomally synthesized peptide with SipW-like signal peptide
MMKKLSLSLLAVAAVSALVMGGTMALFTDSTAATGTFTAGTVELGATPWTETISFANMAPGNTESTTITLTNSGTLGAHLGYKLVASGNLLTCDTTNSLKLTVNGQDYGMGAEFDSGIQYIASVAALGTKDVVVSYLLPAAANNSCQGDGASATLTFYAVQSKNNPVGPGFTWGN